MEKPDLFKLLERMQTYLFDFQKLKLFTLPKPVCLQNEYAMNMFYLCNEWLDDFPDLQTIEKFIEDEKQLFYMPKQQEYYYLYYHLLVAYKKFLKSGKEIYDDETLLDYDKISDYLVRKNLNATKFFEVYLEKGENLSEERDLVHITLDEVTSGKFYEEKIIPQKMTELTLPLESEVEIEIPKVASPSPTLEIELEYPEGKSKE